MSDSEGAALAAPRLVPLDSARHANWRLLTPRRFNIARGESAVPVLLPELSEAAAHYPIVFVGEETPRLAAVVSIAAGQNLFIEADGTWAEGAYVPALLRHRPLAMARVAGTDNYTVLLDEADESLRTGGSEGVALFEGDQPGPATQELLQLLRQLQPAIEATEAFVAAVGEAGLLAPRVATLNQGGSAAPAIVQGLQMVVRDKFAALPDATVLDWQRRGFLGGIYYHLASEGRWQSLLRRSSRRGRLSNGH